MRAEKPKKTAKKRRGAPAFQPSDDQRATVELMSAAGIIQVDQAKALGITLPTLHKYFRDELDAGKSRVTTRVADSLVRQALAGNVSAAIFYLKTQARWRESVEVVGEGGGALKVNHQIDLTGLSEEERDALRAILSRRAE